MALIKGSMCHTDTTQKIKTKERFKEEEKEGPWLANNSTEPGKDSLPTTQSLVSTNNH